MTGPGLITLQYKYIYTDYKEGAGADRFVWDMAKHGLVLGFGLVF